MNLKQIFGSSKSTPQVEYFLAVEIHESLIKSVCWELLDGEPKVIGQGSFEMWEDEESLINGVDASISEAVKSVKPEPHRVIFGLPESWLGEEGIHPTKRNLIARLVNELKLEPIGVVPTTQAITHYLKTKEGIPPTAILLEIYNTKVVVSVVKLGKVEATEEVGVSGDLARDVEEGLARMEFDRLPARFLLTDGGNLEDEQQQLLSYPWQERLPFIHMPKVEILPVDLSIKAVALAGGTEAAQHLGLDVKQEEEPAHPTEESNIYVPDIKPESSLEKLGFAYEETAAPTEIDSQETTAPDESPEEEKSQPQEEGDVQINEMPQVGSSAEFAVEDKQSHLPQLKLNKLIPNLSFLSSLKLSGRLPFALAAGVILLIIAPIAFYYFFGSATIKVFVNPQKFSQNLNIDIAEAAQPNTPTLIATKKAVSGSAQESVTTTGQTTVGDKATGSITIANKSSSAISLKAGTPIISDSGDYKFVLDSDVAVASPSASDIVNAQLPKTTGVSVTASKIGAEYNLSKDTTFSVDKYSKTTLYAIAEADFTGGSSRTVQAVSQADEEKVLGAATDRIKQQTSSELAGQDPQTSSLALNDLHFSEKKFDHGVGEEADTLNLNLTGSVDMLVYSKQDLFDLVKEQLQSQIPSGYSLLPDNTQITLSDPTQQDGVFSAVATVDATLIQDVDKNRYASMIKGKTMSAAKRLLQSINGFSESKAHTSPPIPLISTIFLPLNNINIEVVPQ